MVPAANAHQKSEKTSSDADINELQHGANCWRLSKFMFMNTAAIARSVSQLVASWGLIPTRIGWLRSSKPQEKTSPTGGNQPIDPGTAVQTHKLASANRAHGTRGYALPVSRSASDSLHRAWGRLSGSFEAKRLPVAPVHQTRPRWLWPSRDHLIRPARQGDRRSQALCERSSREPLGVCLLTGRPGTTTQHRHTGRGCAPNDPRVG
jgi:hypothetical protein